MNFPARNRLLVFLACLLAMGLAIFFVVTAPPPVGLKFLGYTNTLSGRRYAFEITNRLTNEVWWRIQAIDTNFFGSLRIERYGGNFRNGVWRGIEQYNAESPVKAQTSHYLTTAVELKSGDKVWFVYTTWPDPPLIPSTALNNWRWKFGFFLDRHGLRRAGDIVRPKGSGPRVDELMVP